MTSEPTCSQCGTPALFRFGDHSLCVDHYLKVQQATYLGASLSAAMANFMSEEWENATGHIVPAPRINLPQPPFAGGSISLSNISVANSTFGAINTGTVQHLDAAVTLFKAKGEPKLAEEIARFTEAVLESNEIADELKDSVLEQLKLLVAQAAAKPENRSPGISKSVLAGISRIVAGASTLHHLWEQLEPLFHGAISGT